MASQNVGSKFHLSLVLNHPYSKHIMQWLNAFYGFLEPYALDLVPYCTNISSSSLVSLPPTPSSASTITVTLMSPSTSVDEVSTCQVKLG